ncbi:MAG: hypothetical protein ACYDAQ_00715 [Mycobacteriales bacterium]
MLTLKLTVRRLLSLVLSTSLLATALVGINIHGALADSIPTSVDLTSIAASVVAGNVPANLASTQGLFWTGASTVPIGTQQENELFQSIGANYDFASVFSQGAGFIAQTFYNAGSLLVMSVRAGVPSQPGGAPAIWYPLGAVAINIDNVNADGTDTISGAAVGPNGEAVPAAFPTTVSSSGCNCAVAIQAVIIWGAACGLMAPLFSTGVGIIVGVGCATTAAELGLGADHYCHVCHGTHGVTLTPGAAEEYEVQGYYTYWVVAYGAPWPPSGMAETFSTEAPQQVVGPSYSQYSQNYNDEFYGYEVCCTSSAQTYPDMGTVSFGTYGIGYAKGVVTVMPYPDKPVAVST